jgi:hypothetical protein
LDDGFALDDGFVFEDGLAYHRLGFDGRLAYPSLPFATFLHRSLMLVEFLSPIRHPANRV